MLLLLLPLEHLDIRHDELGVCERDTSSGTAAVRTKVGTRRRLKKSNLLCSGETILHASRSRGRSRDGRVLFRRSESVIDVVWHLSRFYGSVSFHVSSHLLFVLFSDRFWPGHTMMPIVVGSQSTRLLETQTTHITVEILLFAVQKFVFLQRGFAEKTFCTK